VLHNLLFSILVLPNFAFFQLEKYDFNTYKEFLLGGKKKEKKVCYSQDFGGGGGKAFAKLFYNGSYV
jgi:hypothetical protein